MAHAYHNKLVEAFQLADPSIKICNRGKKYGYTHLHGPNQVQGKNKCFTHSIVIEKFNGTISIRHPVALALGARMRPEGVRIESDPLGYSCRSNFGRFSHAFEAEEVLCIWGLFVSFAVVVINMEIANDNW
jgi:hypothetical protein